MTRYITVSLIAIFFCSCYAGNAVFDLKGTQSMCITGKGPGQDGAVNPYLDRTSTAVVQNIGKNPFEIRVQEGSEIKEIIPISPSEKKEVVLKKGYVLLFDSNGDAKAKVKFKKS